MPDTFLVTVNGEEFEVDANSPEEAQALAQRAAGGSPAPAEPTDPGLSVDQLPNFARGVWQGIKATGTSLRQGATRLASEIDLGGKPLVDYNPEEFAAERAGQQTDSAAGTIGKGLGVGLATLPVTAAAGPGILPQVIAGATAGAIGSGAYSDNPDDIIAGAALGGGGGVGSWGLGRVARGADAFTKARAAKALGFTKAEAPLWEEAADTVVHGIKPFRVLGRNKPVDLERRIASAVDEAGRTKDSLLAGPLGDRNINPENVRRSVQGNVDRLRFDFDGGAGPQSFGDAETAIAARRGALADFDAMQADAARAQGAVYPTATRTTRTEVVGRDPYTGKDITRTVPDVQIDYRPSRLAMTARRAEGARDIAMKGYKTAQEVNPISPSAGAATHEVGLALTGELNSLDPALAAANRTQHHGIIARDVARRTRQSGLVPSTSTAGIASRVGASMTGSNPAYGATLGAGNIVLRSPGWSGRAAAMGGLTDTALTPFRDPRVTLTIGELIAAARGAKDERRRRLAAERALAAGRGVVAP